MYLDMRIDLDYPETNDRDTQKHTPRTFQKYVDEASLTASRAQSLVQKVQSKINVLKTISTRKPKISKTSPSLIIEVITLRPRVSKRTIAPKKYKYEIQFKHEKDDVKGPKLHLKKPEFQINRFHIMNPNEQFEPIKPRILKHTSVINRDEVKDTTKKSKKITKRSLSIEMGDVYNRMRSADFQNSNRHYLISHRKSFDNISVLSRLKYLEDELKVAQTQIKNDSKIIKDLSQIMLANQRTDYAHRTTVNNNEKPNRDVVIDLKLNINDLNKIVSLSPNEMKQDTLKNAVIKKLNLNNQENTDKNAFVNFKQRAYNGSNTEGRFQRGRNINAVKYFKANELNLANSNNKTAARYYTKPKPRFPAEEDTYERVEERVYDSDSNKDKNLNSDGETLKRKYDSLNKQPTEGNIAYTMNDDIVNKNINGFDKIFKPYITPRNTILPNTDTTDQNILSEKYENLVDGPKSEIKSDRVYEHNINSNLNTQFIARPADKQSQIYINSRTDNKYKGYNYAIDEKKLDKVVTYGQNMYEIKQTSSIDRGNIFNDFKVSTTYSPLFVGKTQVNVKYNTLQPNLKEDTTKLEYNILSESKINNINNPLPYTNEFTEKKHMNEEVERRIENDNAKFVKTAFPSDVQKRFNTASPGVEELLADNIMKVSVTGSQYHPGTKILKFAKTTP